MTEQALHSFREPNQARKGVAVSAHVHRGPRRQVFVVGVVM